MRKGQRDTRIGQQQGDDLAPSDPLPHPQHGDEQRQRRIGEQDQPLEAGRDVLQAEEVEHACAIVAEQAEQQHRQPVLRQPVLPPQRRRRPADGEAHPEEGRQGEDHAQREQRHCVDRGRRVGQLDEDRLQRKAERSQHREDDTDTFGRPVIPGHAGQSERAKTNDAACARQRQPATSCGVPTPPPTPTKTAADLRRGHARERHRWPPASASICLRHPDGTA
ncbi:MAG: hypothetical protein AW12_01641 [Candidatus Accumulibacter sp. BA-94]|nr:MAG: hypothetical protein AW12_01641 [Candidatus Accumulibacter sp. BA-94]